MHLSIQKRDGDKGKWVEELNNELVCEGRELHSCILGPSEGGFCQVLTMLEPRAARMIGCRTFAGEYAGRVARCRGMVGDWRYGIRVVPRT